MRRLLGLLLRILGRSVRGKTRMPKSCDVLFVLAPKDTLAPRHGSLVSPQLDRLVDGVANLGLRASFITRPEDSSVDKKSKYPVIPFPVFSIFKIFLHMGRLGIRSLFEKFDHAAFVRAVQGIFFPSWEQILDSSKPVVVIGIGLPENLCEAARPMGIRTAEVQHGIFYDLRLQYFPTDAPDFFLAWDQHSASKALNSGLEAMVIGHPLSTLGPSTSDFKNSRLVGCVALSYGCTGAIDKVGSITPELLGAITSLKQVGFKMIIRPHPVIAARTGMRWKRYVKTIKELVPDADLISPMEHDWNDTISMSDILLTISSASAFEFGTALKPSIVLDHEARKTIQLALDSSGLDGSLIGQDVGHVWPDMPCPPQRTPQKYSSIEFALKTLLGRLGSEGNN